MKRMAAGACALALAFGPGTGGGAALAQDRAPPVAAQAPQPTTPPQQPGAASRAAGVTPAPRERAAGPPQQPPLGAGPWDFATDKGRIHVEVVARGLKRPWGMAFLPDGGMLVTERAGALRLVDANGKLDPEPITGLPDIYAVGIAGLMDIALHPDFANNHLIYLAYSKPDPKDKQNATLAVLQAKYDGGHALSDVKDIYVANAWYGTMPVPPKCCGQGPTFGSFGGRLQFDKQGHLFVTSGDRNYGEMVQDPSNDFGKILRLNDDGSVPSDNPWVGKAGYAPEVWSTGHRNPLGLTIDPATGTMWETEFGPRGGDELNRIVKGGNYGWILVTQGFHYNGTPGSRDQERARLYRPGARLRAAFAQPWQSGGLPR